MHNLLPENLLPKPVLLLLCAGGIVVASSGAAQSDIYRFVTVDGVETFTDAPLNKDARVVIRETAKRRGTAQKGAKARQPREMALGEIVEKTVAASLNPPEAGTAGHAEPRLPPVGGAITSGVGMRIDPIDGKWRHHNGIDIAIPEGTPVRPAAAGTVVFSGERPGYGRTVLIEHDNGMITLYAHNSRLAVAAGRAVDADTVIALSGSTGRSTGPHLHFEAWQAGVNVTPAFMPGNAMQPPRVRLAAHKPKAQFRKEILADGSLLFTNVPASVP